MKETKAALESHGVSVEVRSPLELSDLPAFDLAHVFNLQMPESAAPIFEILQKRRGPIVFSPIYWDPWAYWFEAAADEHARWRWPAKLIGKERARQLYVGWQRRKAPKDESWKTQRRLLQQASRVLPNSKSEADHICRTFSLDNGFVKKLAFVPNGVDATLYEREPSPSVSFFEKYRVRDFVLQIGTISPVKNQLGLINALFDLPVPIVFIGHTPPAKTEYARQCRSRAEERGNVVFVEHLTAGELPGIYALAAVHALPSWRETPGLVSLEAAACGCRVVSTSVGSARDYFGALASYCHPSDLGSIRDAVEGALNAPVPSALRRHVLDNFTWRHAGEATLASYEHVLRHV